MLGLERRIVLEDHGGDRHAYCLLETVEECFFVLLPLDEAEQVAELQARPDGGLDEALELLVESVAVIGVRDHRFLPSREVPEVLARSRHHVLVLTGARLAGLPDEPTPEELSELAFLTECKRRLGW